MVVGRADELLSRSLRVKRLNWIAIDDLRDPMRVAVKIRHRHEAAAAVIEKAGEDEVLVTFETPQRAITPGQAAVFYDGDRVVRRRMDLVKTCRGNSSRYPKQKGSLFALPSPYSLQRIPAR